MFTVDESKTFKELVSQIDLNEVPPVISSNITKVLVTKGVDELSGSDKEVQEFFAAIEKHFPKSLGLSGEVEVETTSEEAFEAQSKSAVEALEISLEFEDDEVKIAEINEAIEAINLALELNSLDI